MRSELRYYILLRAVDFAACSASFHHLEALKFQSEAHRKRGYSCFVWVTGISHKFVIRCTKVLVKFLSCTTNLL